MRRALERGRETMRWNVTTILHRMQGVLREFLRYHGYEVGRWLEAVPESSWERGEGALAWVLWALFADAEEIGLKPPPFW